MQTLKRLTACTLIQKCPACLTWRVVTQHLADSIFGQNASLPTPGGKFWLDHLCIALCKVAPTQPAVTQHGAYCCLLMRLDYVILWCIRSNKDPTAVCLESPLQTLHALCMFHMCLKLSPKFEVKASFVVLTPYFIKQCMLGSMLLVVYT